MGGVLWGLALFFGLLWSVSAWRRRTDAREAAAFLAEREKQFRKWVGDYVPSRGDLLPTTPSWEGLQPAAKSSVPIEHS